ncbi:MAG TPA: hypothetical protein VKY38_09960 [Azoarcus sp.]|nr:hypothetical protein [Azoarcus sp.]
MKRRLAVFTLFLTLVFAPQAFAEEHFQSLRELLSNPDNYRDHEPSDARSRHDIQHEPKKEYASQQEFSGNLDEGTQGVSMTLNPPMHGTSSTSAPRTQHALSH